MIHIDHDSNVPLYRQIVDAFHLAMSSGELRAGSRLPARLILARTLGVNPTTVRNAYDILENEGLVISKVGSGTYVTQDAPQRLKKMGSRHLSSIVVVVGHDEITHCTRDQLFTIMDILGSLSDALGHTTSYKFARSLSRASLGDLPDDTAVLIREKQGFESSFADELIQRGIPVIGFWSDPLPFNIPNVHYDPHQAARLGVQHLIDCGYQKIGYIGNMCAIMSMGAKFYEFTHTLFQAGLDYQVDHVSHIQNLPGMAYHAASKILNSGNCPEAFFVDTDYRAMEVIAAINNAGLKVPDDIGVVGYDNIPESVTFSTPLTTVSTPRRKAGNVIAELLLNWSAQNTAHENITLTSELIIRHSTGANNQQPAHADASGSSTEQKPSPSSNSSGNIQ